MIHNIESIHVDILQVFDTLLKAVDARLNEVDDACGPAIVMQCRTGRGRTTTAMAIACVYYQLPHLTTASYLTCVEFIYYTFPRFGAVP